MISSKKKPFCKCNIFSLHLIRYFKKANITQGKRYNLVQLFEHLAWKQRENLDGRVEKNSASTSLQGSRSISGGISLAVPGTMANLLRRAGFQRQNQEVHQVDNREKKFIFIERCVNRIWIIVFFLFIQKKLVIILPARKMCTKPLIFLFFSPLRNVNCRNK